MSYTIIEINEIILPPIIPSGTSLAWPDPLRAGVYGLEIISAVVLIMSNRYEPVQRKSGHVSFIRI